MYKIIQIAQNFVFFGIAIISNFEKLIKIAGFTKPQNIKINLFFFLNTSKFLLDSPCLQYEKLPSLLVG